MVMTYRAAARQRMHMGEIISFMNLEVKWKEAFPESLFCNVFWGFEKTFNYRNLANV